MSVAVWWLCTNISLFTFKPWWSACNSSQIGLEPNREACIPKLGSALRPDGADNQFTYLLDRKISSNQLNWQGLKSSHSPNPCLWSKWDWEPKKGCSQLRVGECQHPALCFSTQAMGMLSSIREPKPSYAFHTLPLIPYLNGSSELCCFIGKSIYIYSLQTHPTLKASALQPQFLHCTPLCWNTYSSP